MKIYGIIWSSDGYSSIHWFADAEKASELLNEDDYNTNEGSFAEVLTLPEGVMPEDIGIDLMDDDEED